MASIKAGGSGYFLVNDKPYQRGAYEAAFSGGTAGAETHIRIFAVDTSDGIRNILSLTEISTIESDSGTYADAAELKTALEGFFFRNIGGGGGGAVDSVNGQTGSVVLNLENINDVPPYPNDGGEYVLVENDGSLSWEVPGGGGVGLTYVSNAEEFKAALDDQIIGENIYCLKPIFVAEDTLYDCRNTQGPRKIYGQAVVFSDCEVTFSSSSTVTKINFYNDVIIAGQCTMSGPLGSGPDEPGLSFSTLKKFSPSLTGDLIINGTDPGFSLNAIYELKQDGITVSAQANATIQQQQWFSGGGSDAFVKSVTAGTGGVSVTGTATDPVINFEQTTAGLLQNVYFTGDEETTAAGTFYLTKRADRGTVADERQTVVLASNETEAFSQDFLGAPSPTSAPIISGVYAAFPILQVSTNQNNQRFKIEAYIADADGVPTGVGDGPVGTLGVNTVLIADSGIIDLQANNPTNVNCQGDVINTLTIQQGERFRYRVIAERIGTGSQNKTVTLFQGSDYNSYFQIPAPGIIQPSTPSQYIVSFAKAGLITAPITLETQAGFTQTTGKYFGGGVNAVVKGFRFNSGLGSSIQAADFTVQLNYRDPDAGAPYTPAQGTLLVEETLFSTSGALATVYNVSGEVILDTPVSILADKVYFLDISNLGGINFTDLEVEVLIETTPMTPSQFSFPFLF